MTRCLDLSGFQDRQGLATMVNFLDLLGKSGKNEKSVKYLR